MRVRAGLGGSWTREVMKSKKARRIGPGLEGFSNTNRVAPPKMINM